MPFLVLATFNLYTKFEVPSFMLSEGVMESRNLR